MKTKLVFLLMAIMLVLGMTGAIAMAEEVDANTPQVMELIPDTVIKVHDPIIGNDPNSYKVYYGTQQEFEAGSLPDLKAQADTEGIIYRKDPSQNLYIVPDDEHRLTHAIIIGGNVEYYIDGVFDLNHDFADIDILDRDLLTLTGFELSYTDGENRAYVDQGGSSERNLPRNYTGPTYYGVKQDDGSWLFELLIYTERAHAGQLIMEEQTNGITLVPNYQITIDQAASRIVFTGPRADVMTRYDDSISTGEIKAGAKAEIEYDTSLIKQVLVKVDDRSYTEPVGPEWEVSEGKIGYRVTKHSITIKFVYVTTPRPIKFVVGTNRLGLSTNISMTYGSSFFSGTIDEVNAEIERLIQTRVLDIGELMTFSFSNADDINSVQEAIVTYPSESSEGIVGQFGSNVLTPAKQIVQVLTADNGYRYKINFRSTAGMIFINESTTNKGVFTIQYSNGEVHTTFISDIAQMVMYYFNSTIAQTDEIRSGTKVTVTFPDSIDKVRMSVGNSRPVDITDQLFGDNKFIYTESVDDVVFYVLYQNAIPEIVISPTLPLDPGPGNGASPIPPASIGVSFGAENGAAMLEAESWRGYNERLLGLIKGSNSSSGPYVNGPIMLTFNYDNGYGLSSASIKEAYEKNSDNKWDFESAISYNHRVRNNSVVTLLLSEAPELGEDEEYAMTLEERDNAFKIMQSYGSAEEYRAAVGNNGYVVGKNNETETPYIFRLPVEPGTLAPGAIRLTVNIVDEPIRVAVVAVDVADIDNVASSEPGSVTVNDKLAVVLIENYSSLSEETKAELKEAVAGLNITVSSEDNPSASLYSENGLAVDPVLIAWDVDYGPIWGAHFLPKTDNSNGGLDFDHNYLIEVTAEIELNGATFYSTNSSTDRAAVIRIEGHPVDSDEI